MSDEREDAVRRLLAESRHTEPMPADVVARLDAVLADLGRDAAPEQRSATVTDLGARRRHRARTWLLGAAAAVVVGVAGTGVVSSLDGARTGDEATSGAAESRDEGGAAEQEEPPGTFSTDEGPDAGDRAGSPGPEQGTLVGPEPALPDSRAARRLQSAYALTGAPEVREERLRRDVRRLADLSGTVATREKDGPAAPSPSPAEPFACDPAAWGPGRLVPVTYLDAPAVLVVRPAEGGRARADLLACGTGEVLRSVWVAAR